MKTRGARDKEGKRERRGEKGEKGTGHIGWVGLERVPLEVDGHKGDKRTALVYSNDYQHQGGYPTRHKHCCK